MSVFGRWMLAAPAAEVEQRLAAALVADRNARRRREWGSRLVAVTVVYFFVMIFAWLLAGSVLPFPERAVGRVLVIGSAAGFLGALLLGLSTVGRTTDARKVTSALALTRTLKADMRSDAPLRLELDLRGYERGVRRSREGNVFSKRRKAAWRHEWLRAQGVLADGTRLELSVVDRVKWRLWAKRSGARTREALSPLVVLRLRLAKSYGPAADVVPRLDGDAAPFAVHGTAAAGRRLEVRAALPATSRFQHRSFVQGRLGAADEGRWLMMLLRWTYAALGPR